MNHERFIRQTYKKTFLSSHSRPTAALIVKNNKCISYGVNKAKSHPKQLMSYNPKREIHAELSAVIGLREGSLEGTTIYVVRRCASGNLGLAKPCEVCSKMLTILGVKQAIYSCNSKDELLYNIVKFKGV